MNPERLPVNCSHWSHPDCYFVSKRPPISAVASRIVAGTTWLYVSIVKLFCECPDTSMTARGWTFWATRNGAHVVDANTWQVGVNEHGDDDGAASEHTGAVADGAQAAARRGSGDPPAGRLRHVDRHVEQQRGHGPRGDVVGLRVPRRPIRRSGLQARGGAARARRSPRARNGAGAAHAGGSRRACGLRDVRWQALGLQALAVRRRVLPWPLPGVCAFGVPLAASGVSHHSERSP